MSGVVTLTTDFGYGDPWVSIMKGVMLSIRPGLAIVDVTHDIPPRDIMRGALCLGFLGDSFPEGTVHVAVVDPGVGTNREAIIVRTARYFYVGPNNGIFSMVASGIREMVKIENTEYLSDSISATFHGRDIFAHVAAHLTQTPMEKFGPPLEKLARLDIPEPSLKPKGAVSGEIIYFDRFGNAFTNITRKMLLNAHGKGGGRVEIDSGGRRIAKLSYYYQSAREGELGAIINGFGHLELFTPNGDAREAFGLKTGDPVKIRFFPGRGR